MLRFVATIGSAFLLTLAAPAVAGDAELDAEVLLVRPNQSGQVPKELASMQQALKSKGYSGAAVAGRRSVHLDEGRTTHVAVGGQEVDLTLLSVQGGQAKVRVAREGGSERVTTVSAVNTRFLLTVPKKKR
jgi:hypothetical protein